MRSIIALVSFVLYAASVQAQPMTFSSGSTGADGPLTYASGLGLVYFPPTGLAARANNIYNFTTITIGTGTTVRVSGWVINGPVYWLAQSDVTISGMLDISGQLGHAPGSIAYRAPSEPGAGGYPGGVAYASTGQIATAGNGPGGGAAPPAENTYAGLPGTYSGSSYLLPLIGGSGGAGGGAAVDHNSASGGGAGGGAILIASTTKITITGTINAQGGAGGGYPSPGRYGAGGSGGAVRLMSNTITNSGTVQIAGGQGATGAGINAGPGIVRFEGFTLTVGTVSGGTALTSTPYNLALPVGGPSLVSVTSINGVSINANPFLFPDATITTGTAVPVVISGVNIPSGTTGNLLIYSENAPDQIIPFTLTGTLASTTATVSVPYPSGGSRGFAKAVWVTP